ncbi:hypothetical protein K933_06368 [Candidatus Halobonum tyrrellensis G22]|uniref:Uncharacterized protein n=1 Tax=Candidatus Halobonum tyrrellensis G22 TaxID=1324957 RepID=V4GUT1_9EURY|nr:hypothetical protein K933_06368 [Candidatus Halobonum tyrrellensis G22]
MVPDPPGTVSFVGEVQAAVPLVPESEDDCCARLMRRCGFDSRDVARTWLTFLRAVGLARETDAGFERTRVEATADHLRTAYLDGVYGAREAAEALLAARDGDGGSGGGTAPGGVAVDAAFARVRERVPGWERNRTTDWEDVWRERVGLTLEWFVLLGLATEADGEYAASDELVAIESRGG